MGELFGTLGLAWPRLLLYPGGLSAMLIAWLLERLTQPRSAHRSGVVEQAASWRAVFGALSAVAAPLVFISLLPLPGAVSYSFTLDLLTALALLEWPYLLLLSQRARDSAADKGLIESYVLMLLAALLWAQGGKSLLIGAVIPKKEEMALLLALCGALGWTVALLHLLSRGPLATQRVSGGLGWGLRLRALGQILLATLPWSGLLGDNPWLLPVPPLIVALLLGGMRRWHQRIPSRYWHRILQGVAIGLIALMLWASGVALQAELR